MSFVREADLALDWCVPKVRKGLDSEPKQKELYKQTIVINISSDYRMCPMRTIYFLQYFDSPSRRWKTLDYFGTLPLLQSKIHGHVNHFGKFYYKDDKPMKLRVVRGSGTASELQEIYQILRPDNQYNFR